jgi:P27 family predicted phage terminase small subunit
MFSAQVHIVTFRNVAVAGKFLSTICPVSSRERGVVSHLDRGALAAYCGAYALWAEAMEQIQKFGTIVKSPTGYPIQSPYLAIANRQAEIMLRVAAEFGFTPASRSRISAPPENELPLLQLSMGEYQAEPESGG